MFPICWMFFKMGIIIPNGEIPLFEIGREWIIRLNDFQISDAFDADCEVRGHFIKTNKIIFISFR